MKTLTIPKLTPQQYELIMEALFECTPKEREKEKDKARLTLIRKLEKETTQHEDSRDIKETLIEKILDRNDGDQILIDILDCDLGAIAERELNHLNEVRLLEIYEELLSKDESDEH